MAERTGGSKGKGGGSGNDRQRELGEFLRHRRGELVRSDFDLPPVGRGRTVGLRREEVAFLAGVSVTWYTWLEQGRAVNPSRQVVDALAVAMRLTTAEHDFVLSLAGLAPLTVADPEPASPPRHLQDLLDALDPSPAFVITTDWSITGWNRAYAALYPGIEKVATENRNLLLLIFTDPAVRDLLPDWAATSRRFLAQFRADAGAHLGGRPAYAALVRRLQEASPEFAQAWADHHVEGFGSDERRFTPTSGRELVFEEQRLAPVDHRDLRIVVYLAPVGSTTRKRMLKLMS